jgi:hypothetical protein
VLVVQQMVWSAWRIAASCGAVHFADCSLAELGGCVTVGCWSVGVLVVPTWCRACRCSCSKSASCLHILASAAVQPADQPQHLMCGTGCRAAKTISMTLLPRRRGQYTISLLLRGSSMVQPPRLPGLRSVSAGGCSSIAGSTGAAAAAPPGLIAVAGSSHGSAAAVLGSDAAAVNGTGYSRCHSAADSVAGSAADVAMGGAAGGGLEGKPLLATVSVTATASFPSLLVTDVFCQGIPKQVRSLTHLSTIDNAQNL